MKCTKIRPGCQDIILILSRYYGQEHKYQRQEVAGTQGGAGTLPESVGRKERSNLRHHQQVGTWATTRPCLDHPKACGCAGRRAKRTDEGRRQWVSAETARARSLAAK